MDTRQKLAAAIAERGDFVRGYPLPPNGQPLDFLRPGPALRETWRKEGWTSFDWNRNGQAVGIYFRSAILGMVGALEDFSIPRARINYTGNRSRSTSFEISAAAQASYGWEAPGSPYYGTTPWVHTDWQQELMARPGQLLGYVGLTSHDSISLVRSNDSELLHATTQNVPVHESLPVFAHDIIGAVAAGEVVWWDGNVLLQNSLDSAHPGA